MIGRYKDADELRRASEAAGRDTQNRLERQLREKDISISFVRDGVVYRRTREGLVRIG